MVRHLCLILGIGLLGLCLGCKSPVLVLHAQSFPLVKTLAWDAPTVDATHGAAESYVVRLDGTILGSPTVPTQSVTFQTGGAHTLTVVAVNAWGTSPPATVSVNIIGPGTPANLSIH